MQQGVEGKAGEDCNASQLETVFPIKDTSEFYYNGYPGVDSRMGEYSFEEILK